jgi:hypothetical protein
MQYKMTPMAITSGRPMPRAMPTTVPTGTPPLGFAGAVGAPDDVSSLLELIVIYGEMS